MRQKLHCSIVLLLCFLLGYSQEAKFKILPYTNLSSSINNGQIEIGPEITNENWTFKPFVRLPLSNKAESVVQIDRFSSNWKAVCFLGYTIDKAEEVGEIKRNSFVMQIEYGINNFKYYPTGDKENKNSRDKNSYGIEVKYIGFFSEGKTGSSQISPQFRLRYSYDWKAASEVGVVNPINSSGLTTTTNLIISPPQSKAVLSPAFSLQIYNGDGNFSYSPTVYYDFMGDGGSNDPFGGLNRLRLESWIFYYPLIKNTPNVKVGVSPFLSIRTAGTDNFNAVEYGGMVTLKFGTSFLEFL